MLKDNMKHTNIKYNAWYSKHHFPRDHYLELNTITRGQSLQG